MKYLIFISLIILPFSVIGQDPLNGGFEDWGYDELNWTACRNWLWATGGTPCGPFAEVTEKTDDSFSGNWAIRMESQICYNAFGEPRLRTGRAHTDDTEDPSAIHPLGVGGSIGYSERPEELSFYYKFHQESTDSAAVYMLLFNYDVNTHDVDTIGVTSGYIHEEATEYTEFVLPIEYYKNDTPSFIHILFITNKTIGDMGRLEYEPAYNFEAGTTLWVDNLVLRGGTVSTTSPQEEAWNFSIYPNPTEEEIRIDIPQQIQVGKVQVYDNRGRIVKEFTTFNNTLNISDIPKGIYYLKLETNKGMRFKKVIKK